MTAHAAWRTWTLQPVVLASVAIAAWAYSYGVRALWRRGGRGRGISGWRAGCFAVGLLAILAALCSPLDAVADELLSAHMAQHLLLVLVAAPLLVLGSPGMALSGAMAPTWRRRAHRFARLAAVRAGRLAATNPVISWLIATGVLWAWHLPALYDAAVQDEFLHVVEHASFLASALLFWWVALQPSGPRRLARGADVLYMFAGALQSCALGALLAFAPSVIYPVYAVRTLAWGASPVADQQLAGLLMWVPSFVVYLVAAGALFVGWLRAVERETRRVEGRIGSAMTGARVEVQR